MMLRRRTMMAANSKPYDAEIEYLETGLSSYLTAYIDTGVVPKNTPRVIIKLQTFLGVYFDKDVFGFANNTQPSFIGDLNGINGNYSFRYYRYYSTMSKGASLHTTVPWGDVIEVDAGYQVIANGNVLDTYTRESFANNTQSIYIFRGRVSSGTPEVKVFSAKIYDGDILMRDYIPVRVGTTGYLYDKVSGQLFGNSGSGDFILGNDI